ncbi:MAG: hypothetical protein ACD_75C01004G0001 [uncultured bacterium]|nr:MAG: hypothetical protein ACD_75C01004G0001 [uncultured bacterium]
MAEQRDRSRTHEKGIGRDLQILGLFPVVGDGCRRPTNDHEIALAAQVPGEPEARKQQIDALIALQVADIEHDRAGDLVPFA